MTMYLSDDMTEQELLDAANEQRSARDAEEAEVSSMFAQAAAAVLAAREWSMALWLPNTSIRRALSTRTCAFSSPGWTATSSPSSGAWARSWRGLPGAMRSRTSSRRMPWTRKTTMTRWRGSWSGSASTEEKYRGKIILRAWHEPSPKCYAEGMRENQTVTPPWQADVHVSYVLTRYERYQGQLVTETTGVDHYYTYHENAPSLEAVREAWQDGDYEVSDYRLTDLHTRDTWDE